MEKEVILLDTSVMIDYYRKKDKSKSFLLSLSPKEYLYATTSICEFEIYTGVHIEIKRFWDNFFSQLLVFPFDSSISREAALIDSTLRKNNKQIELPDLFIAATAIYHKIKLATLNKKHFERIESLYLLTP